MLLDFSWFICNRMKDYLAWHWMLLSCFYGGVCHHNGMPNQDMQCKFARLDPIVLCILVIPGKMFVMNGRFSQPPDDPLTLQISASTWTIAAACSPWSCWLLCTQSVLQLIDYMTLFFFFFLFTENVHDPETMWYNIKGREMLFSLTLYFHTFYYPIPDMMSLQILHSLVFGVFMKKVWEQKAGAT